MVGEADEVPRNRISSNSNSSSRCLRVVVAKGILVVVVGEEDMVLEEETRMSRMRMPNRARANL